MSESGEIRFEGDWIRYRSSGYGAFDLRVDEVKIIGEFTNDSWAEDYFLCFVTGRDRWFEASFYARGRDEFLARWAARVGSIAPLALANSTTFASRVLWPMTLADQPLFDFEHSPSRERGWLGWWQKRLGAGVVTRTIAKAVNPPGNDVSS